MGYDEKGNLVYKIPASEPSPVMNEEAAPAVVEEDEVVEEESSFVGGLFGKQ